MSATASILKQYMGYAGSALSCLSISTAGLAHGVAAAERPAFDPIEASIQQTQQALAEGNVTSTQLVKIYLERIDRYDHAGPSLNAILSINDRALTDAKALDNERSTKGPRSLLHGIPIIVKDNYDVLGMPTTGGCLCLRDFYPRADGTAISRLKDAGAIIIGKSNMDEFALNIMSVSSLGGQTRNPYALGLVPGGSSGGTAAAVAANLAMAGLGTDTSGSIRIPSSFNNLVGVRPTIGLISRRGIMPLASTQDTGGTMTRSVADAAVMLDVMAGYDAKDVSTAYAVGKIPKSYTDYLDPHGLKGARIGVVTKLFSDVAQSDMRRVLNDAVSALQKLGASTIPIDVQNLAEILKYPSSSRYEFKFLLRDYLNASASNYPIHGLSDVLKSGKFYAGSKELYERAESMTSMDSPDYAKLLLDRTQLTRNAIMQALADNHLDAIVYPTTSKEPVRLGQIQDFNVNSMLSSFSGYPAVTMPAGFTTDGVPVGIEFLGRPFDEPLLIKLAYAYEQGTHHRQPPILHPEKKDPSIAAHSSWVPQ